MTIDQRIEALTMTLELAVHQIEDQRIATEALTRLVAQDAENIRALARVAEAHEKRLSRIEG
jgi:hypothetical protein